MKKINHELFCSLVNKDIRYFINMILILLVHQYYLSGVLILFYINQPIWGTSSFCQLCFYLLYADNLLNKCLVIVC